MRCTTSASSSTICSMPARRASGISGLSLGGYLSALMASVEPRLKFAIPNSPLVTPIDMALQWQPLGPHCCACCNGAMVSALAKCATAWRCTVR